MAMLTDPFSSYRRPALVGERAAVSAAHPLAAAAAQEMSAKGGSAADAVIAAHAVIAVINPDAGGLGGDGFFLVREKGAVTAVNAAGRSAAACQSVVLDNGASVAVPGLVDGWIELSKRWGKLNLPEVLGPAIRLAENGMQVGSQLLVALNQQKVRLAAGGAGDWPVIAALDGTQRVKQPALAKTLREIGEGGRDSFYAGEIAAAIVASVAAHDGQLSTEDLARHRTVICDPLTIEWKGCRVHLQPPMSQGVILGMALKALAGCDGTALRDHAEIELTLAAFEHRARVVEGGALLNEPLSFDPEKASGRAGPRPYLHTAGVSAADSDGLVVTSLLSVFDDFGSGIYVPAGGFVLNNRALGFTTPPNHAEGGKYSVHTLAPVIVERGDDCLAMATPGADGQVQTLLQILGAIFIDDMDVAQAVTKPRWRSESGRLLIEESHPAIAQLSARGHELVLLPDGDVRFGAVVSAGIAAGRPFAISDWRRDCWSGVV